MGSFSIILSIMLTGCSVFNTLSAGHLCEYLKPFSVNCFPHLGHGISSFTIGLTSSAGGSSFTGSNTGMGVGLAFALAFGFVFITTASTGVATSTCATSSTVSTGATASTASTSTAVATYSPAFSKSITLILLTFGIYQTIENSFL